MIPKIYKVCQLFMLVFLCFIGSKISYAAAWMPVGPNGGDARAFAEDPGDHTHLYLGTATGWLLESHNGGTSWVRLANVGKRDDLVLDNILVDSSDRNHLLIGAHDLRADGGMYVSHDGGVTWSSETEMQGQSIRALAQASSNPNIFVAGSLNGVYRSQDRGDHWTLISPAGSTEIHEIESVAIDPKNPAIIYAGTWHLPWKTTDGGAHWENIKKGLIDDSDVFSIIVDPKNPSTLYLSACSGIYKSTDAGADFAKIQGIPSTARRTRVLQQDPEHLETVFAGTTQGLYRTQNAGSAWGLLTSSEVIINDVYVDPTNSQHVLLATDRNGVLMSNDGAATFHPSNDGFSARQISALISDPSLPNTFYAGVVSDQEGGGVFMSGDGGIRWAQTSSGLDRRDVLSLVGAPDGSILAGTNHGIARLKGGVWLASGQVDRTPPAPVAKAASKPAAKAGTAAARRVTPATAKKAVVARKPVIVEMKDTAYAMARAGSVVYAATSTGLLKSDNAGAMWTPVVGAEAGDWRFVAAQKSVVMAAQLTKMTLSTDAGATWQGVSVPANLTQISAVAVDGTGRIWVGGREGAFYSTDQGSSWHTLSYLNVNDISSIVYDAAGNQMLVTSRRGTAVYAVNLSIDFGDAARVVTRWDTGWHLRLALPAGNHLVGATLFDGVVMQPQGDARKLPWE